MLQFHHDELAHKQPFDIGIAAKAASEMAGTSTCVSTAPAVADGGQLISTWD